MTFEEFFRKKKIDLTAMQSAEPGLFSEFKEHYEAMGEKSFDHTKKYWFNKLRLQYRLAPEVKEEKVVIENRLAEQTIVESLTEPAAANVGFKPRFKAGAATAKPVEAITEPTAEHKTATDTTAQSNTEGATPAVKPAGFKPRFNAKTIAPKAGEPANEDKPEIVPSAEISATPKPAGFKPRFNAAKMAPKAEEQVAETKPVEDKPIHTPAPDDPPAEASPAPKPAGFKPRFNAAKMAPKKEDTFEQEVPMEIKADDLDSVSERTKEADNEDIEIKPAAEVGPKMGFKPRFNPKNTKPQPPKTEE
ncbi:hypothetical protein INP83_20940 [Mucilaginibacter sp. 21P]|uniref:hypothetical protein n=1 Tax=Mucilaginibacter sp. 21P TaxID=2778902 RepID=UPI001C596015|nr:hypothetical protein [Mucilaginibacter sp. 21P]QXV65495.1 hypothetical protein INP83_20940 [Mucilaginibacter sp. 21P]